MKRFKKLFLMCAAVSAVAAVSCTAAMAANDFTATYNADAGTVTIGGYTPTGTQQTLVVLDEDCETVKEDCIKQILQQEGTYASIPVGTLEDGVYYVRIGGDSAASFLQSSFTVGVASTRKLGDATGDDNINTEDAAAVAYHVVGTKLTGEDLQAADLTDDGSVNTEDASAIALYVVGDNTYTDGTKTVGDKQHPVSEG